MTGGRLRRVAPYLVGEADFCLTYGDGVSDVDISALIAFHRAHGCRATLTAARSPARFGMLDLGLDGRVASFMEKPRGDGGMINGGFFVLKPDVLQLVTDDRTVWERGPLESLANSGQLRAYRHEGFWQPMDTLRDRQFLEELWANGSAPWKSWT